MLTAHAAFHMAVAKATGNPLFELVVRPLYHASFGEDVTGNLPPGYWVQIDVDHRTLLESITGQDAEAALGRAHIPVNKNAIPNDPEKPFVTSGIRLGSPAITTRGFTEIESEELAHLIADVLSAPDDGATLEIVRASVSALARMFPVYRA
jgi:glycine/serine hydroxymethyltransferase